MLAIRSFSLREERRCECERDSTTSAMSTPWVRFFVCIFTYNDRLLYVNIQASLWPVPTMRYSGLLHPSPTHFITGTREPSHIGNGPGSENRGTSPWPMGPHVNCGARM